MGRERAQPSETRGLQQRKWPANTAALCTTTTGQPVAPQGKAHPWAGVGERARCPARKEAESRQGSSTHLFVLGSWWEAGGGMSEVLQCPLQG